MMLITIRKLKIIAVVLILLWKTILQNRVDARKRKQIWHENINIWSKYTYMHTWEYLAPCYTSHIRIIYIRVKYIRPNS